MTNFQLKLPVLHPGQALVAREAGRRNAMCMGRRWGKSLFVLDRLVDTPSLGLLDGKDCAWMAATNRISDAVWALAKQVLEPLITSKDEQHRSLRLATGSQLDLWSLESAGVALGRRYGVVAVDEAAIVPNLRKRWLQEIRPTLTDYRGAAWFLSTPRGRMGDFYDLCQMPATDPAWKFWQMPSASNPYLDAREIEDARKEYDAAGRPDLFRQEYLAEFVTSEGAVFKPELIKEDDSVPRLEYLFAGIDPALTASKLEQGDETAIAVGGVDIHGEWWLIDLIHGRWAADGVTDQIWSMWERHKPWKTWIEGGPAGLGILPWVQRRIQDECANFLIEKVSHMREKLAKNASAAALVNSGKLHVPRGAPWVRPFKDQLAAFTGGKDGEDDLCDAFGIFVRGARQIMGTSEPTLPKREDSSAIRSDIAARLAVLAERNQSQSVGGPRLMWARGPYWR
jgi:predicted phage terminase large subunit-like protein